MPKVIIIPDNQTKSVCQDVVTFANSCQSDFDFYLQPQIVDDNSPLNKASTEVIDILTYLERFKQINNYKSDDFVLAFYNGVLKASSHGLSNLFCAGSRYDESQPCTGVVSLKYLGWEVLEEKYNYEVQKHSIKHLIICGIIGAYTQLNAHHDIGCLLDMNMQLTSFNLKLKRGYYLCSAQEFNCYGNIKKERYGNAILQLCEKFKSNNYQTVINELIMGDKIKNSIVAKDNSSITDAKNLNASDIKKLKTKHTIIGFILGVVSELVAMLIYEHFIK